jgi:DNA-binding transcriptional ArsR family regulator
MYDDVSLILRSKLSRRILKLLNNSKEPLAPKQISQKTNIARSNVSTKLGELRRRKLVKCVNPEARKWRFYEITGKGKKVLKKVSEI